MKKPEVSVQAQDNLDGSWTVWGVVTEWFPSEEDPNILVSVRSRTGGSLAHESHVEAISKVILEGLQKKYGLHET